ncbi:putative reverse transcriptase domain-containing protein [Tanacetum coccineum]
MNMTLQSSIKDKILAAQKEASDEPARMQRGLDELIKRRSDGALYYLDQIWVPLKGDVRTLIMDEAHKSKYFRIAMDFVTKLPRTSSGYDAIWVIVDQLTKSAHFLPMREDYKMDRLARLYLNEIVARNGVLTLIISDCDSRFTSRLKALHDCQKSYADKRRKPLEFSVGEHVLLKVSSWKGVVRFGKKEKLAPRFVRPFEITKRIGPVAYRLRLPEDLKIQVDAKLNYVEEPVEILEREFKKLKRRRIAIVKIMPPKMTTRSAGRSTATPRGRRMGGRTGRGGGSLGELRGKGDGQTSKPNIQGVEANGGVHGVSDFSTIIAQQLQNLLPTILAQVGNQGNDQGINRNQNGYAVNDNIQGDVRNVIVNNDQRGCTYKEFLACHPKEYNGKGGAIVNTRWIEKMESVQDMSGCGNDQKVKYTAG